MTSRLVSTLLLAAPPTAPIRFVTDRDLASWEFW